MADEPDGASLLPDYLSDLNAMHEAEKVLDRRQADLYAKVLGQLVECGWADFGAKMVMATTKVVSASASQRAEAFLRAIEHWKDDKPDVRLNHRGQRTGAQPEG